MCCFMCNLKRCVQSAWPWKKSVKEVTEVKTKKIKKLKKTFVQICTKWLQNCHKMEPKLSQNGHKKTTKTWKRKMLGKTPIPLSVRQERRRTGIAQSKQQLGSQGNMESMGSMVACACVQFGWTMQYSIRNHRSTCGELHWRPLNDGSAHWPC